MRVVVVGVGFANKGAEAMLKTIHAQLEAQLGPLTIVVWDAHASESHVIRACGFEPVSCTAPSRRIAAGVWLIAQCVRHPSILISNFAGRSLLALYIRAKALDMLGQIGHFDAVLDASGFAYADGLGVHAMTLVEPLVSKASREGKPIVFMPQAWGPFDEGPVRQCVSALLGSTGVLAYARDAVSLAHLADVCPPMHFSSTPRADIAFAFTGGSEDTGWALLKSMGWSEGRSLVGLAPNMRAFRVASQQGQGESYLSALTEAGRMLIDDLDVDVVLQANEIKTGECRTDDRRLCEMIAAEIDRSGRVFFVDDVISAEESKALLGCCDFVFASRFHSLVFSLSRGIACAALGWSHKYVELMRLFGLEDSVLSISGVEASDLRRMLLSSWSHRAQAERQISDGLAEICLDNANLFDEVADRLLRPACTPIDSEYGMNR